MIDMLLDESDVEAMQVLHLNVTCTRQLSKIFDEQLGMPAFA
jgi:hypothetical protein